MDIQIRAALRRLKSEGRARLAMAWHIEAFARTKELPPLDKLFPDDRPKRPMSDAEIRNQMTRWRFAMAGQAGAKAQIARKTGGSIG